MIPLIYYCLFFYSFQKSPPCRHAISPRPSGTASITRAPPREAVAALLPPTMTSTRSITTPGMRPGTTNTVPITTIERWLNTISTIRWRRHSTVDCCYTVPVPGYTMWARTHNAKRWTGSIRRLIHPIRPIRQCQVGEYEISQYCPLNVGGFKFNLTHDSGEHIEKNGMSNYFKHFKP